MAVMQQLLLASGAFRLFIQPSQVAFATAESFSGQGASAAVSFTFNTNGIQQLTRSAAGELRDPVDSETTSYRWLQGAPASLFSIRIIPSSGFFTSGLAVNQWHSLNQSRSWSVQANAFANFGSAAQSAAAAGTIQIARSNNLANILASGTYNIAAQARSSAGFIP